jgi:hypothetical protein
MVETPLSLVFPAFAAIQPNLSRVMQIGDMIASCQTGDKCLNEIIGYI